MKIDLTPSQWAIVEQCLTSDLGKTLAMANKEEDEFYASLHEDYAERIREVILEIRKGA